MKKILFLIILTCCFSSLFAQMSDAQVIEYVQTEYAKGKSQTEIGTALLQSGVSTTQIQRIKTQVEQEYANNDANNITTIGSTQSPYRTSSPIVDQPVDLSNRDSLNISQEDQIFGRNIFNKKNLSFTPDTNTPTPPSYKLSAGDEVVIDIWGASQANIRNTITPDGTINLDNVGPVFLSGATVADATNLLKRKLSEVYPGVDQSEGAASLSVTLSNIRSIQVNVIGEILVPGTYTLSSLSSVFNALYTAGGINDIGSLREINVYRNNAKIATIDVYDYLLYGKTKTNISLEEGDVIIVPPYKSLVKVEGLIKRPMYYEMKKGETVSNLISYAGGFEGGAYQDELTLTRKTGGYDQIYTINKSQLISFGLEDGDLIAIRGGLNQFSNRVSIEGQVFRPGNYEVGKDIITVKDLIQKAGGLRENAYLGRALLTREKDDLSLETLSLNLTDILNNTSKDIILKKNDTLSISANVIEEDLGPFVISGLVAKPGSYPYASNTSVKDLIVKAGGLLSSASVSKVDVARRIIDPTSITSSTIISDIYSFSIDGGLVASGANEFMLEPYDQVYIRKSPGYHEQRSIRLQGEVLFPGDYIMENKAERTSDIIKKAGGLTPQAYAKGAKILRPLSSQEIKTKREAFARINTMMDANSIPNEALDTIKFATVGIELDLALKNPGSEYDVILKVGDQIIIPEYDNTVRILGAVMNPNAVVYKKGKSLAYYINQAGGYAENAKKKNTYIVYMNGTTTKGKKGELQPGSTIIVPTKDPKSGMSLGEKIAIASSVTSMASVIALLINSID